MPIVGILLYVSLCAFVGYLGRERAVGFAGYFVLSLLLTPLVMALVLLVGAQRNLS
ncbi:hypothetical protein [Aestuariivirga sp.]|jgi:hypothetical protein|uniref:hypothetical protein n=1 Tax=Aestuariivirga sp. TaxID=2650926 RepID=UPI00378350E8